MKKIRIREGDFVILKGKGYFEKVKVTEVKKRIANTEVGVKFNSRTLQTLNSIFKVVPFDEKVYLELDAYYSTPSKIKTLLKFVEDHRDDTEMMVKIYKGLERINKRIYV